MVLVVGSINMDICLDVDTIPDLGETVMAVNVSKNCGGKGANQAVAAAKLGADIIMLGCVGKDENGEQLLYSLKSSGVNTEYIMKVTDAPSSSAYICISKKGENSIVVDSSANKLVSTQYIKEHEFLFNEANYCIMQMEIPIETVETTIELCKKHNVKIVMNPSPLSKFDIGLIQGVDYLIPNEMELARMLGKKNGVICEDDCKKFMRVNEIGKLLVTLGSAGCKIFDPLQDAIYVSTKKREAVDTTGAGDTFLGAFVTAISENKSIEAAVNFANIASGIEVTRLGAQKSMPTRKEVDYEFEKNFT